VLASDTRGEHGDLRRSVGRRRRFDLDALTVSCTTPAGLCRRVQGVQTTRGRIAEPREILTQARAVQRP